MGNYILHNGELYHYGVLGMKWGRRKGNAKTTTAKTRKKSNLRSKWNNLSYDQKVNIGSLVVGSVLAISVSKLISDRIDIKQDAALAEHLLKYV